MAYVIYKIHCNITGDDYYGSTMNYKSRMKGHRSPSKYAECSSHTIIRGNDYSMAIVEQCAENTKMYALTRERFYIENNPCINKVLPIISKGDAGHKSSQYYADNKEEINNNRRENKFYCDLCDMELSATHKARHIASCMTKLIILPPTDEEELATQTARKNNTAEKCKAYVTANADKVKTYKDSWYQQNKDKISEQAKIERANPVMVECECGKMVVLKTKARHMRSKYHQENV